jgi:hypothetical protein
LLTLRIGDLVDIDGNIQTNKVIGEEKRGKRNVMTINTSIRETLTKYLRAYRGIEKNLPLMSFSLQNEQIPTFQDRLLANVLGKSSVKFATKLDCLVTTAPTPYARPGAIMPANKECRWKLSWRSSIITILPSPSGI